MSRRIPITDTSADIPPQRAADAEFESCIERFEAAWSAGSEPEIDDYLVGPADPRRRELLGELVCIDLEYRWKTGAMDGLLPEHLRPTLEDYVAQFAELGDLASLPVELICEEYRVRHRWGDGPTASAFIARFPRRAEEIAAVLEAVDDELRRETPQPAPPPKTASGDQRLAPLSDRDYVLVKHIGSGGMGKVYAARCKSPDRPVAIKMLRKQWLRHPAAVERFISEAQTIERLRHPRIVPVHGLGRTRGGGYFIVMDLMDEGDLATVLAAGPAAVADAARWACQAAEALTYAHQSGVLHCDVKPSNLLLDRRRDVALTDFGLARSIAAARHPEEISGTLGYMAPEQFGLGAGLVGPATDVYGLGATLYTALTGRTPFAGSSLIEVVKQHVGRGLPVAPRELRPEIPADLDTICLRCLTPDPHERFLTMDDVAGALRRCRG